VVSDGGQHPGSRLRGLLVAYSAACVDGGARCRLVHAWSTLGPRSQERLRLVPQSVQSGLRLRVYMPGRSGRHMRLSGCPRGRLADPAPGRTSRTPQRRSRRRPTRAMRPPGAIADAGGNTAPGGSLVCAVVAGLDDGGRVDRQLRADSFCGQADFPGQPDVAHSAPNIDVPTVGTECTATAHPVGRRRLTILFAIFV
jgi:hypothetical protein